MYRELKFALAAGADSTLAAQVFRDGGTLTDSVDAASAPHSPYDLSDGASDEQVGLGTVATPRFLYVRNLDETNTVSYKLNLNTAPSHDLEPGGVLFLWNSAFTALYLSNASGAAVKLAIYASGAP